jgi:hypothetical protein
MVKKKGRKLTRYNAWLDHIEVEHPRLYGVIEAEYQNSINSQIEARKKAQREAGPVQGGKLNPLFERK